MRASRLFYPAAIIVAACLLSGCLAVAVPIAAGAAMGGTLAKRERTVEAVAAPDGSATPVATRPQAALAAPGASTRLPDGTSVTFVSRGEMPPPEPFQDAAPSRLIDRFFGYTLAQAGRNPAMTPRDSALLAAPGLLRPERMTCGSRPPAVLIDLDPGRGTFDPLVGAQVHPRLSQALAALRAREVAIFWASRLGEHFGEPLRAVLTQTGLDPSGEDSLLLLRSLDERKQTRRSEIAQRYCLVALLGDERADFDELYLYLKHPETAHALEAMIDSGWFVLDPVIAQASQTALSPDVEAR